MPWDERLGRRIKLKDLQTLMAVIDAGGIGKAAHRLNYSQPAISKAIASLERTLGRRLLERGRRGIELTPYGDALRNCGTAMFDDLRKGIADIDFLADPTAGEIRIGCTEPVSAGIVPATINRVAKRYPRIVFNVVSDNPAAIYRELKSRNIDLAIAQMTAHLEEDHMHGEILYHESVAVVAGANHPNARKRHITLAELADEPWALPLPRSFVHGVVRDAFRQSRLPFPRTTAIVSSAYLRLVLAANGPFITVVPAVMVKFGIKQLAVKTLRVELPRNRRPVGIVTLKDRPLTAVAQHFIEHVRTVARTGLLEQVR